MHFFICLWRHTFFLYCFLFTFSIHASVEKRGTEYNDLSSLLSDLDMKDPITFKTSPYQNEQENGYGSFLNRLYQALGQKRDLTFICKSTGICQQQGACGTSRVVFSLCWLMCHSFDTSFEQRPCVQQYHHLWGFSLFEGRFHIKNSGFIAPADYIKLRLLEKSEKTKYLRYGVCKVMLHPSSKDLFSKKAWSPLQRQCLFSFPEIKTQKTK